MSFELRYKVRVFLIRLRRRWLKMERRVSRLIFAFILSFFHLFFYPKYLGERFETSLHDTWQRMAPLDPKNSPVVIVAFDRSSAQALNVSNLAPWPRKYLVQLLDYLRTKSPKRIFLDFYMTHPGSDPEVDLDLARALRESHASVGKYSERSFLVQADGSRKYQLIDVTPLPIFSEAARSVVSMHIWRSREVDGVVRHISDTKADSLEWRIPLWKELMENETPAFPPPGIRDYISFYGEPGSLPRVSLSQIILQPESLPEGFFRDKIVLVGPSMQTTFEREEQKDTFVTPFSGSRMNGVEIHASVAANIVQGKWVRRGSLITETLLLSILGFALVYFLSLFHIAKSFLLLLSLISTWLCISYLSYVSSWFLPGALLFLLILPIAWALQGLVYYLRTNRRLGEIESTIGVRLEN